MGTNRHMIIAGPGRSGTSLLVSLLSELGLDTARNQLRYHPDANAGYETRLPADNAPYVIKDPTIDLRQLVENNHVDPSSLDAMVIPLRDLDQAALSRKHRSATSLFSKRVGGTQSRNPWRENSFLARRVYHQLEHAASYDVPVVLLAYPRFAQDVDYAFRRIGPLLTDCTYPYFVAAWKRAIDPTLIRHVDDSIWLNLRLTPKSLYLLGRGLLGWLRTRSRWPFHRYG